MTAPTLTGFAPTITFAENTVNATPQLLDGDVVFTDAEGDLDGGTLTLTGLLAEDRASVRNEGTGAGQIGLSGSNVTYGGVIIGTLAGGSGATLTITFNASATVAAIDALVQNLTYANVSNTPTATRSLTLNIIDAAGESLAGTGVSSLSPLTGAANPFNGFDVGSRARPTLVDIDGDGDQDLVVGAADAFLRTYRNGTNGASGAFVQLNVSNPVNFSIGENSAPAFLDVEGDGDPDLVFGNNSGGLLYYRNGSATTDGFFTAQSGAASPFDGINVGGNSTPTFADLDEDGDLDLVVGAEDGLLRTWLNGTTGTAGAFTQLTGASNPFAGIDVGGSSTPSFVDLDGDGDQDLVVGESAGTILVYRNGTATTAGAFTQLTGAANPFNGVDVGTQSAPTFTDIDGDGDMDAVIGAGDGTLRVFENRAAGGLIAVNVTGQIDTFTGTTGDDDLTGDTEGDILNGLNGNDRLDGGLGADVLLGFGGDDTLIGGSGAANQMQGGLGDDTYIVSANDTLIENADEGTDTVQTTRSVLHLRANFENLSFTDNATHVGHGNALANVMNGGTGFDTLSGLDGNDTLAGGSGAANVLIGGRGDDTYTVTARDTIIEAGGEGTDTVNTTLAYFALAANVENLNFAGTGDFAGIGNGAANVITGGTGRDTLTGGGGDDTLNGGDGLDVVLVSGLRGDYAVIDLGGGAYRITDSVGARDGVDTTQGIERVRFSDGATVTLASLAIPMAPVEPPSKHAGGPQVLPGLVDDEFVTVKTDGALVQPGLDALELEPGAPALSSGPGQMLTLADEGLTLDPSGSDGGRHDHDGWLF